IAASALATLKALLNSDLIAQTLQKEKLFRKLLIHPLISEIRGRGLMLAPMVENSEMASKIILKCLDKGLIMFWLLFEGKAIRITPPLTISEDEIYKGCNILIEVLNEILTEYTTTIN
ncbi:MAG: aminotransferase class III-fold pyridoxal phosphate-dependent enzyme, partial [Lutibacter sp.]|nr:aminotransferase class III-fold pyridoxal phosphate-dependent enzyme [Lutibacter sp.]